MKHKKCGALVMYRYTWPGSDEAFCCLPHAAQIAKIAEAIGSHQQIIPLSNEEFIKFMDAEVVCSTNVEDE